MVDEVTAVSGARQIANWSTAPSADPTDWIQIFSNTSQRLTE